MPVEHSPLRQVPISLLVESHARDHPDSEYAILASFPTPGDNQALVKTRKVSWGDLHGAMMRAAHILNPLDAMGAPTRTGSVMALLAVADNLIYQTLSLAIVRSGNIVS